MSLHTKGRTDSSGLRLYYRPVQPGQLDVGILTTGLVPLGHLDYSIPPKAPQFHTYGVCNTSLFSQVSPGQRPGLKLLTAGFFLLLLLCPDARGCNNTLLSTS